MNVLKPLSPSGVKRVFCDYDAGGVVTLCGVENVFTIMTVSVETVECDGWKLYVSAMWQGVILK